MLIDLAMYSASV